MPELPEVETIVRDLQSSILGSKLLKVVVQVPAMKITKGEDFLSYQGLKVETVTRAGKYIVIFLEKEKVIVLHLRMTGRLQILPLKTKPIAFERARLYFDKFDLAFGDIRKFGKLVFSDLKNYLKDSGIDKLGPEPLSSDFSLEKFSLKLSRTKRCLKAVILDQSVVCGIGNIYADEACFSSGVLPYREADTLENEEIEKIYNSIKLELEKGIRNRGTSFSDFEDAYGKRGENQKFLKVYGRGGEACLQCQTSLVKMKVAGRGTVCCKNCQK